MGTPSLLGNLPSSTMSECKPNSELLSAIQGADTKGLKDVTPVENPAAKHDMAMFGVEKFDKGKLKNVETEEKMFFLLQRISSKQRRLKDRVDQIIDIVN